MASAEDCTKTVHYTDPKTGKCECGMYIAVSSTGFNNFFYKHNFILFVLGLLLICTPTKPFGKPGLLGITLASALTLLGFVLIITSLFRGGFKLYTKLKK